MTILFVNGTADDDLAVKNLGWEDYLAANLGAGNDILNVSGDGEVLADLGDGDDVALLSNYQGNRVEGGAGNDTILASGNNSTINGGAGDDVVDLSTGGDLGGYTNVDGAAGGDSLTGGSRRDYFEGGTGNDTLRGGDSEDHLNGDAGRDQLHGGDGNDGLNGNAGRDVLLGNDGDDWLTGGAGNDTMTGGAGADQFSFWGFDLQNGDKDIIRDYAAGDTVWLGYVVGVDIWQDGSNTVIDYVSAYLNSDGITPAGQIILRNVDSGDVAVEIENGSKGKVAPAEVSIELVVANQVNVDHFDFV
jgi:Ca2+-binding RTX toxin-like protein